MREITTIAHLGVVTMTRSGSDIDIATYGSDREITLLAGARRIGVPTIADLGIRAATGRKGDGLRGLDGVIATMVTFGIIAAMTDLTRCKVKATPRFNGNIPGRIPSGLITTMSNLGLFARTIAEERDITGCNDRQVSTERTGYAAAPIPNLHIGL